MPIVDTHCHATPYWFEPVEVLLDQMDRNGVDHAVLIQINGVFDNSYLVECMQRFPGRFSGAGMVDVNSPDALDSLAQLPGMGLEGVRFNAATRSPGDEPLAIWRGAAEAGLIVSCGGQLEDFASEGFEHIVRELPDLKVIIEHLGGGGRDDPAGSVPVARPALRHRGSPQRHERRDALRIGPSALPPRGAAPGRDRRDRGRGFGRGRVPAYRPAPHRTAAPHGVRAGRR